MDTTKLAILGLGSRSTLHYLKELNRSYNEKKGRYSTCPLILLNANFDKINPLLPNPSTELEAITQHYINEIEKLDVERILIPNITLHETIDNIVIHKKIIHPLHLSAEKIKENKWTKIVMFGSLHSMKSTYIRSYFELNSIEVTLPIEEDMLFIDEVRKQVYNEKETKELIENYHLLIAKYIEKYPVVLACTELSIFKPEQQNLLDMAQLQIEEAIKGIY